MLQSESMPSQCREVFTQPPQKRKTEKGGGEEAGLKRRLTQEKREKGGKEGRTHP